VKERCAGEPARRARQTVTSFFIFRLVLQSLIVGGSTLYLCYCGVQAHRRSSRSWQQIAAGLDSLEAANLDAASARSMRRAELKAAYRMAGVALEMADYAERSGDAEPGQIETLRSDAVRIRIEALKALLLGGVVKS
jgi:hypothetical protein